MQGDFSASLNGCCICYPLRNPFTIAVILRPHPVIISRTSDEESHHSQLAESVWGGTYDGSKNTLRVYVQQLRTKVKANSPGKLIIRAKPRLGYFVEAPVSVYLIYSAS